ncbi:hypothetical protein ACHAWF_013368, partial [Thalassiosira exigua]
LTATAPTGYLPLALEVRLSPPPPPVEPYLFPPYSIQLHRDNHEGRRHPRCPRRRRQRLRPVPDREPGGHRAERRPSVHARGHHALEGLRSPRPRDARVGQHPRVVPRRGTEALPRGHARDDGIPRPGGRVAFPRNALVGRELRDPVGDETIRRLGRRAGPRQVSDILHHFLRRVRERIHRHALHEGRGLSHHRLPPDQLRAVGSREAQGRPEPRAEQRTPGHDRHHVLRRGRERARIGPGADRKPHVLKWSWNRYVSNDI